jgi:hypothetical protein
MTSILTARARGFVQELEEIGFGLPETGIDEDGEEYAIENPINGDDAVDVINQYLNLLRKLPALAGLADAAEACRVAGGSAEFHAKYERLLAALAKVKES